MAEQARKFGARIAELRDEKRWKQRDLVTAMAALGDQSLNTNQLSRYENGGAMPGEQRQGWFADALDTTVADLHAGPIGERQTATETPDVLGALNDSPELRAQLDRIEKAILGLRKDLGRLALDVAARTSPARQPRAPKSAGDSSDTP